MYYIVEYIKSKEVSPIKARMVLKVKTTLPEALQQLSSQPKVKRITKVEFLTNTIKEL